MDGMLEGKHTREGESHWLYPVVRKGTYYKWRSNISYAYLIVFFAGPFISINKQPLLMLNFVDRKFVILGQVFWPQDIFLFMLASLVFVVCIVLFTIAFGRIFCGWICPQTIFMEMVFRKIEIWIEGDAARRRKLDAGPITREKLMKKTAKHGIFILLSFLIANTFLAYIIGTKALFQIIIEPVSRHWLGFAMIWIFTLVFYLVYSRVRELVCTYICPYGRLQGVLIDEHTLVIAYNEVRGDPRGKRSRISTENINKGDCVDCGLCVAVCPTGIDIRNGTQLECINCTACIDACNQVMDKTNRPLNLIGYYSAGMIRKQEKPAFTTRMMAYTCVITILVGVLCYFVFSRSDMDLTVMRSAGSLYQQQPNNHISNIYSAEIINKSNEKRQISLQTDDPNIQIKYIQAPGAIPGEGTVKTMFFLMMPVTKIHQPKTDIQIKLFNGPKLMQMVSTTFVGPINN